VPGVIIKDSRTPRGRAEEQPLDPGTIIMLKPVGGLVGDGRRWSSAAHHHIFLKHPTGAEERKPRVTGTVTCEAERCGKPFTTAQPTLARYCSDACRTWAHKQRKKAVA
jgi:hypothetical protein